MRILFANTAPIITRGIGQVFADLGHQVQYVFLDQEESILPFVQNFSPDFVFNDGGINRMHKLFPILEELGIPHVYWAIEDPVSFDDLSLPYALKSYLTFTPCQENLPLYQQHGINAHLLMFGCHPTFHHSVPSDLRFNRDIIFVGNNYAYHPARQQGVDNILQPLIQNGFDIAIYGNEWWLDPSMPFTIPAHCYAGYMANEDLPAACSTARIMLGLHSVDTSATMMSMRTFEILGSGGFYLTQWTPAIEHFFVNHHHLVWTRSPQETVDLVNFYLARPDLREKIARQGQAEVYQRHTYHHRVQEILPWLQTLATTPCLVSPLSQSVEIKVGRRNLRIQL